MKVSDWDNLIYDVYWPLRGMSMDAFFGNPEAFSEEHQNRDDYFMRISGKIPAIEEENIGNLMLRIFMANFPKYDDQDTEVLRPGNIIVITHGSYKAAWMMTNDPRKPVPAERFLSQLESPKEDPAE